MSRGERLAKLVAERELDQLFVSDLTNVRYLTGFAGTNGACLVGGEDLVFFTDFRYTERAKDEVSPEWERPEAERELVPQIVARMKGRVGFEDAKLSVRQLARLEAAAAADDDVEFVPAGDLVEQLRAVKEPESWSGSRPLRISPTGSTRGRSSTASRGTPSATARACEARLRELGAEPSFPPIVAAAENGALPHAEPGEREIGSGELVVFDMGALFDGYCSDCTRTFATGEPGDEAREVYELVRRAQRASLRRSGPARAARRSMPSRGR